jgi:hypothetical protein
MASTACIVYLLTQAFKEKSLFYTAYFKNRSNEKNLMPELGNGRSRGNIRSKTKN